MILVPRGFWRPTLFIWRPAKGTGVDSSSEEALAELPLAFSGAPSREIFRMNFDQANPTR